MLSIDFSLSNLVMPGQYGPMRIISEKSFMGKEVTIFATISYILLLLIFCIYFIKNDYDNRSIKFIIWFSLFYPLFIIQLFNLIHRNFNLINWGDGTNYTVPSIPIFCYIVSLISYKFNQIK